MSRFGSDPRAFFDSVYRQIPPWEVGGPQPALWALLDEYPPQGPALDLGCGSGDLAIALARRSLEVVGIDFADAAVAQARGKTKCFRRRWRSSSTFRLPMPCGRAGFAGNSARCSIPDSCTSSSPCSLSPSSASSGIRFARAAGTTCLRLRWSSHRPRRDKSPRRRCGPDLLRNRAGVFFSALVQRVYLLPTNPKAPV